SASVTLTVTPTPPTVTINTPANNTTVFSGTNVNFTGTATDAGDGNLSGGLRWSSDRDGLLGTGASIATSHLSVGTHTITAAAPTPRGSPPLRRRDAPGDGARQRPPPRPPPRRSRSSARRRAARPSPASRSCSAPRRRTPRTATWVPPSTGPRAATATWAPAG